MCYEEQKSIIFDETNLGDVELLKKRLFDEANDPRSYSYKRVLRRPKIAWLNVIGYIFAIISCAIATLLFLVQCGLKLFFAVLIVFALVLLFIVADSKRILCTSIKIYQRYAPSDLRNKCRFEPSCSEYMLLAIEKYGVYKGVKKGINRLRRCNINNGGYDYP
jgi:putative membrane protein insertion efficiency factor